MEACELQGALLPEHGENGNSVCFVLLACNLGWLVLGVKGTPSSSWVRCVKISPCWSVELGEHRAFVRGPRSAGPSPLACGVSLERDLKLTTKNNNSGLLCELGKSGDFALCLLFSSYSL